MIPSSRYGILLLVLTTQQLLHGSLQAMVVVMSSPLHRHHFAFAVRVPGHGLNHAGTETLLGRAP
jgi:hypothetical protein